MILLEVLGDPAFHLSQNLMQINGFFLSFLVPASIGKDPLPTLSDAFEYTGKGRGQKKNCEKAVRLTAWVDPPSPEAVRVL